jgi:hypothetical protein
VLTVVPVSLLVQSLLRRDAQTLRLKQRFDAMRNGTERMHRYGQ